MKMKRIAIALAAAAVMAASAVSLTACGGGAPASIEDTTWAITEMATGGMDMTSTLNSMGGASCVFDDGVLYLEMMGQRQTIGSYTYENGVLTIEGDQVNINGDTISFTQGSDTITMKKK